jgi:CheY-like chemotaxis protein
VRLPKTAEPSILLIDRNPDKQRLRATVFRNCEIDVHTAGNLSDALRLCRIQRFELILLAPDHDSEEASLVCDELRKLSPKQRVGMFVGPPRYVREMGVRERQPIAGLTSSRRLHLVEPQPQRTQWSLLMERLLSDDAHICRPQGRLLARGTRAG